jgi:hypothetical protein
LKNPTQVLLAMFPLECKSIHSNRTCGGARKCFSPGEDILGYTKGVANKYEVTSKVEFETKAIVMQEGGDWRVGCEGWEGW